MTRLSVTTSIWLIVVCTSAYLSQLYVGVDGDVFRRSVNSALYERINSSASRRMKASSCFYSVQFTSQ